MGTTRNMVCRALKRKSYWQGKRQAAVLLLSTSVLAMMAGSVHVAAQSAPVQQSMAQNGVRTFNILAQPLRNGISEFNRQSGVQVSQASGSVPAGVRTNAVSGQFTPQEALRRMLSGTGVSYRFISSESAVIGSVGQSARRASVEDATTLEPIVITGARNASSGAGFQGTPDWVFNEPASVSVMSRTAIEQAQPRSTADLFSGMSGVTATGSAQNPGVSINVRGMQDQTRVTTTIDGARQNYQQSSHGSTSRVYIDPSLIRTVEVEKNAGGGVGAGGSLGGIVNFRTLTVEDILREDQKYGGWIDATTGTNAYEFYGTGAVGARLTDNFDLVAALSHKKIGEYEIGQNGTLEESADYYGDSDRASFTNSETWSGLFKADIDFDNDQRLELGVVGYDSKFTTSTVSEGNQNTNHLRNLTGTLTYTLNPNDLVDLKAQLWYNRTKNNQWRSARNDYGEFDVDYGLDTYGLSIENTSRFDIGKGELTLHYGAEAFLDKGSTDVNNYDEDDADNLWWFTGTAPIGERWLTSTFANAKYEYDWLAVSAGGRYDWYKITGDTSVYGGTQTVANPRECRIYRANGTCLVYWPTTYTTTTTIYDVNVDQSGGKFSPEAMIAVKPVEGIQIFGKYAEGFRPGTLSETLLGGAHIGNLFYYAPNGNLDPETSRTWEAGVNLSYDDVLTAGDSFRMKAVYFDKTVQDFIALGLISGSSPVEGGNSQTYYAYTNLTGDTKLRGVEIEANYDTGRYYLGGSFTYTKGDYSSTYNQDPWGTGAASSGDGTIYYLFVPPEYKFTADMGARFFDEKLLLGARVTHIVPSEQKGLNAVAYAPDTYTTLDLYGSYKFNESTSLRFAVNNVTDVAYVDPLNSYEFPAPGRTATVSLKVRF